MRAGVISQQTRTSGLRAHKPNFTLIVTILVLVMIGLVAIASASSVISHDQFGDNLAMLKNQLINGVAVGLVFFIIMALVPYKFWRRVNLILLIATLLLLIAVFIPGVGINFGGANRWINLGVTSFQPSELAKLTMVIFFAAWLDKRGKGIKEFATGVVPFLAILGLVIGLILAQPDLGTLTVIAVTAIAMFYVAGARLWHLFVMFLAAIGFLGVAIKLEPYRLARFTVFLNPAHDPQGLGYQITQSLLAVGSGGLFGLGLGQSRQKYNYLPEPAGDSIFAVMSEELGFLRILIVVALFLLLGFQGYQVARRSPDNFAKLLAVGITTWFVAQAFINMGALIGVLPLTGIPLPFISFGGTALAVSLAAAGILVNVSRYTIPKRSRSLTRTGFRREPISMQDRAAAGSTDQAGSAAEGAQA
ncbi:MAG: putative lipid II flippase FtsW [Candidatus Andersenbacteria bacterium]